MAKHTESAKPSTTALPSSQEENRGEAVISKLCKERKKAITEGINELFQYTHHIPVLSIPDDLAFRLDLSSTMSEVLDDLDMALSNVSFLFTPKPIWIYGEVGIQVIDAFAAAFRLLLLAEQDQFNQHHERTLARLIESTSQLQFSLGALSAIETIAGIEYKRQIRSKGGNDKSEKYFRPAKQRFVQLIAEWAPIKGKATKAECIRYARKGLSQFIEEKKLKLSYDNLEVQMRTWLQEDPELHAAYSTKLGKIAE